MKRSAIAAISSILVLAGLVSSAFAIETEGSYVHRERDIYHRSPLVIDVWTSKGDGAVYYPGERIRVYFRASRDCHVTLYNIDTQGYVHLLYPARSFESHFVVGGVTYRIPSRRDPYDLIVSGPQGVEYIEAVASAEPFHDRAPWYLDPEYGDWGDRDEDPWSLFEDDYEYYGEDYDYFIDRGIVRGDPFLGIQRINSRMIPSDYPSSYYATAYTSFYVGRRVSHPRYLCYDCHWHHPRFDPYGMGCLVFDIRIDRTWVYSPRIVLRDYRPRYYYRVKDTAPVKYKGRRHFWSSGDGLHKLKKEFSPTKPRVGPPRVKILHGDKQKYPKDWGPSRMKTWKTGKGPPTKKVEGLRKRLESDGVLKSKSREKGLKEKRELYERKKKADSPKKEVKPSRSRKEVKPSGQKDRGRDYEKKQKTKTTSKPKVTLKPASRPMMTVKTKARVTVKTTAKKLNRPKEVRKTELKTKAMAREVKKAKEIKKAKERSRSKEVKKAKKEKQQKDRKAKKQRTRRT